MICKDGIKYFKEKKKKALLKILIFYSQIFKIMRLLPSIKTQQFISNLAISVNKIYIKYELILISSGGCCKSE